MPFIPLNKTTTSSFTPLGSVAEKPTLSESLWSKVASATKQFGIGVAKGVGELGKQGEEILNAPLKAVGLPTPKPVYSEINLEPEGGAQTVGKFVEKVAEYAVPEKFVASGFAKLAPTTLKLLQTAKDFGVSMIQTKGDIEASATTAGISGLLRGLPADIPAVKNFALKSMSKLSGYPSEVLEKALTRSQGVIKGTKEGESALVDAVKKTIIGVQDYAKKVKQESSTLVNQFHEATKKLPTYGASMVEALQDTGNKFLTNLSSKLRSDYNIGFTKDGTLLFNRTSAPSNIVNKADQGAIQEVYQMARSLADDYSIKNIDAKIERMITLLKKTPAGSPTGAETKVIIQGMIDDVVNQVKETASLFPEFKEYGKFADFLEGNVQVRGMINEMKEIFGSTSHPSPKDISKVETYLLQMFNQGKMAVREGIEGIEKTIESGADILGTSAGTLIKSGEEISVRAANLTKRGIFEKAVEAIPRATIKKYIETGKLVDFQNLPKIQKLAQTLRISAQELVQNIVDEINND